MKDLTTLLFKIQTATRMPAAGHVLVSEPFLSEECFNHGVMTISDYLPEEGATGVVLNNRCEYTLDKLLDGVHTEEAIPVFCGGPTAQDRLFFIHTLGPEIVPDARRFADGLYVGGNFDAALDYINKGYPTEGCIRFFIGYSNWVEGQLEKEIEEGTWANMPNVPTPEELLTDAGDSYWHRTVKALGHDYRSWQLLPRNVTCN